MISNFIQRQISSYEHRCDNWGREVIAKIVENDTQKVG